MNQLDDTEKFGFCKVLGSIMGIAEGIKQEFVGSGVRNDDFMNLHRTSLDSQFHRVKVAPRWKEYHHGASVMWPGG